MAAGGFDPGSAGPPGGWPGGPAGPPATRPVNQLAVAALICAIGQLLFWFVAAIPAVILGHMARRQIRQTREGGDGMALASLILGYIGLGLTLLVVATGIGLFIAYQHRANPLQNPPPMLGNPG
jgi:uncharacterized protein DUF4190